MLPCIALKYDRHEVKVVVSGKEVAESRGGLTKQQPVSPDSGKVSEYLNVLEHRPVSAPEWGITPQWISLADPADAAAFHV